MVSLIFKTKNQHAFLYNALGAFAQNEINLSKIESYMPEGRFVPAQFYVEIESHPDRDEYKKAIKQLEKYSDSVSILGVYKAHSYRRL
ncbi:MAG: hypothetical protein E7019_01250 [Alphaproteobacteria bacterium]|nr:hypothetical protein [Alphaproteobacteria bacterium]